MSAILDVKGLNKSFGSVTAAADINVAVNEGEIVGIIGANGAGKTTFVNMVTGYLAPTSGTIEFNGRNIVGLHSRDITRLGICRSFQVAQVFMSMSVVENLMIAIGVAEAEGPNVLGLLDTDGRRARANEILERYQITQYQEMACGLLPQGVRKLLDIAMAMVGKPKILLLDEPTSGVSVEEKFGLMDLIMDALRQEKVTVLFVEHDMEIVERYVSRVLAFYDGRIICDAPPDEALRNVDVRRYVIGDHDDEESLVPDTGTGTEETAHA